MLIRALSRATTCLIVAAGLAAAAGSAEDFGPSGAAKVSQLMKASGYDFSQKTDSVWAADFTGKNLKNFRLIVAIQDDVLVSFVTIAEKAKMPVNVAFMRKLLRYNSTLDRVKIGFDDDGDLFVRCDASVRVLDAKEFHSIVDQVSAASDEVYKGIAEFLNQE
jgi:Putative bacterial sensory transduction regulator